MDIENVSNLYADQMRIKNLEKLNLKPREAREQKQPSKQRSQFASTEVLAERLLMLEHRVEELEKKLR